MCSVQECNNKFLNLTESFPQAGVQSVRLWFDKEDLPALGGQNIYSTVRSFAECGAEMGKISGFGGFWVSLQEGCEGRGS